MQIELNLATILTMALAALMGIVWQNLNATISRIEAESKRSAQAVDDRLRLFEEGKIRPLETSMRDVGKEITEVGRILGGQISKLELEFSKSYPTKAELNVLQNETTTRLSQMEQDLRSIASSLLHGEEQAKSVVSRRR